MSCRLVRFAVMLCMVFFVGCRVCSSPYDNCGPVGSVGGMDGCHSCGGSDCDPLYRNGSVLNGYRGGTYYGGYTGSAQARPYDETQGTPINQPTPARPATNPQSRIPSANPNGPVPRRSAPTPAREALPPVSMHSSPQSSRISTTPAVPKVPLTQESLLQQEQGAVDLRIIDVQDNPSPVLPPTSRRTPPANRSIQQVSYQEIAW
ncbi:MAG: hypothetical protein LBQ54_06210 [Planctomycetaceae bacterium]|nr:hypothetical protein [Planctomycetaceae bacterium]